MGQVAVLAATAVLMVAMLTAAAVMLPLMRMRMVAAMMRAATKT
jgi:hypothetical protein